MSHAGARGDRPRRRTAARIRSFPPRADCILGSARPGRRTLQPEPIRFHAETDPPERVCAQLAALLPESPFLTPAFAAARRDAGARLLALELKRGEVPLAGCVGMLAAGRFSRSLEIDSLPRLAEAEIADAFWNGLRDLCRDEGLTHLSIHAFASDPVAIPPLGRETKREARTEYRIDLRRPDPWDRLDAEHRRAIESCAAEGAGMERAIEPGAAEIHARIIAERHPERAAPDAEGFARLLRRGAGEIFQAHLDGEIVSSVLVLKAAKAGYYHSAGTRPAARERGAAPFLIHRIAEALRRDGNTHLNLGGASDPQSWQARFKRGFGGDEVRLDSIHFELGGPARRLSALFRSAR
jgi:hypothetical protein